MLRYQTKADVERLAERNRGEDEKAVKLEGGGVHQGESAMQRLGAKNGMVDCMIWWHIKRDIFDMPVLVCMSVSIDELSCVLQLVTDNTSGYACVGQGSTLNSCLLARLHH